MLHTIALRGRAPRARTRRVGGARVLRVRVLGALLGLALVGGLAACGDDTGTDPGSSASAAAGEMPDGVTVDGEVGKSVDVTWTDTLEVTDFASTTLVEGDGDTIGAGDNILAQLWVGNGTAKSEAYNSYDTTAQVINLGTSTLPALVKGLTGTTVGSRVLIAAPPADAFGDQGNAQLGIGNKDTVVFVVDVLNKLDGPNGEERDPAAWAPAITETSGKPSALDFTGTPKPNGRLQKTTLIEGTGPALTKGQHVYVDYLGQVYGAKEPFDQSYDRGQPFDFDLGVGGVVKGWDQGLVGVPVGSRVILQIPPDLGYGKAGQPDVGIKGTDTMYFVVDVLAAN
jgi:FKBP-type peptidyl-prolyl cis-trans isomerase